MGTDERSDGRQGGAREITKAEKPIALTADEQKVLAKLLDAAESTRGTVEQKFREFGRTVLTAVFDGDTTEAAALETSANPIVRELLRRAGGTTLRLSRKIVSESVRIAAYEKAVNDETFSGLDFARKALLLPMRDIDAMREAAQHVAAFKLDEDATEAYVKSKRATEGRPPASRLSPPRAKQALAQLRKRFDRRAVQHLLNAAENLDTSEREELLREVESAQELLATLRTGLRKRR